MIKDWLTPSRPGSGEDQGPAIRLVRSTADSASDAHTPCLVVGFDRRPASRAALRRAAELATVLAADLHVVHVVDVTDVDPDPDAADWETQLEQCLETEREQATQILSDFRGRWTYQMRHGPPSRTLASLASEEQALMVVVGARRHGPMSTISGWFDRSVSAQLVQRPLSRPVLVVPGGDRTT